MSFQRTLCSWYVVHYEFYQMVSYIVIIGFLCSKNVNGERIVSICGKY